MQAFGQKDETKQVVKQYLGADRKILFACFREVAGARLCFCLTVSLCILWGKDFFFLYEIPSMHIFSLGI